MVCAAVARIRSAGERLPAGGRPGSVLFTARKGMMPIPCCPNIWALMRCPRRYFCVMAVSLAAICCTPAVGRSRFDEGLLASQQ